MKKITWFAWLILHIIMTAACRLPVAGPPPEVTSTVEVVTRAAPSPVPTSEPTSRPALPPVGVGDVAFSTYILEVDSAPSVSAAAADFDEDGHLDLVISGEPELNIFRGDGRGGFTLLSRTPGGHEPTDLTLADLNEDGHIDMVVANHDTNHLTILHGDGTGQFGLMPKPHLTIAVSPHPHVAAAADLDGDGHLDLIIDDRDGEGLLVLKGTGSGEFPGPGEKVAAGGDPYLGFAVGDINGDGWPDLVTPNPGEIGLVFHAGRREINFNSPTYLAAAAPFAVALGDFNGDGHLDLISAADEGSPLVELFLGNGHGAFAPAAASPLLFAPGGKNLVVGDFNGDGLDDAVVASWPAAEVLFVLGGKEGFQTGTLPGGEHPWGLVAADFNGDGRDDLVIADDGAPQATVYLTLENR